MLQAFAYDSLAMLETLEERRSGKSFEFFGDIQHSFARTNSDSVDCDESLLKSALHCFRHGFLYLHYELGLTDSKRS